MRITHDLLVALNACAKHRAAFAAAFPDGLTVTGEPDADAIARVVAAGLDVGWLCDQVLTAAAAIAVFREPTATAAWRLLANPDNIRPEYRQ